MLNEFNSCIMRIIQFNNTSGSATHIHSSTLYPSIDLASYISSEICTESMPSSVFDIVAQCREDSILSSSSILQKVEKMTANVAGSSSNSGECLQVNWLGL